MRFALSTEFTPYFLLFLLSIKFYWLMIGSLTAQEIMERSLLNLACFLAQAYSKTCSVMVGEYAGPTQNAYM